MFKVFLFIFFAALSFMMPFSAYGQDKEQAEALFETATEHFAKGDYKQAIELFDDILEMFPDHAQTLKMKAVAESNLDYHESSLINFYTVLQKNPILLLKTIKNMLKKLLPNILTSQQKSQNH